MKNVRYVTEVSKLMVDAGIRILIAFTSPFRAEREMAHSLFEERDFIEVLLIYCL